MASDLKPVPVLDLSGGENTVTNPHLLKPNQCQQVINMILDEHGSLRTRDGTLKDGASSPRPDRPIVKLHDLVLSTGTRYKLAILLGTFGNNSLYNRGTTPWTLIGTFSSIYTIPDMLTFVNRAIIAAGNTETIKYYDGTTFAALGGSVPNGAHVAVHLNYLWVGNTSNVSGATAGPSSLQASDLNNPDSWPGGNQTFVAKDDGQSITALGQFTIAESGISPTSTLIIWKEFSGYEATGVLGTLTFSVQKIKSDMGCVAPRSLQFVSGFGVMRLSHRGFALYDGVNDTLVSEEERPRIFGRDQYIGLDWTNISKCMSAQCANPPMYVCACPVAGGNGALQRVFIYDLVRRAWTVLQYPNDISTLQLSLVPSQLPTIYSGDFSEGYVRRLFAGDTTDDGVVIDWRIVSRALTAASPIDRSYMRRMLVKTYGLEPGTTLTATFYFGPSGNECNYNKTVSVTIPACTSVSGLEGWSTAPWSSSPWSGSGINPFLGWGLDPWGGFGWGSTGGTTSTDVDVNFALGRIVNNLVMQLSGSGPGKLRGFELHARAKPLTNSTLVMS